MAKPSKNILRATPSLIYFNEQSIERETTDINFSLNTISDDVSAMSDIVSIAQIQMIEGSLTFTLLSDGSDLQAQMIEDLQDIRSSLIIFQESDLIGGSTFGANIVGSSVDDGISRTAAQRISISAQVDGVILTGELEAGKISGTETRLREKRFKIEKTGTDSFNDFSPSVIADLRAPTYKTGTTSGYFTPVIYIQGVTITSSDDGDITDSATLKLVPYFGVAGTMAAFGTPKDYDEETNIYIWDACEITGRIALYAETKTAATGTITTEIDYSIGWIRHDRV